MRDKLTVPHNQQSRVIMIGYLTLTLLEMGMDAGTIADARTRLEMILESKSEEDARKAFEG